LANCNLAKYDMAFPVVKAPFFLALTLCCNQCCGSVTFWYGSGSVDPCLRSMDTDPDLAIFVLDLQDAIKKNYKFSCLLLFEATFTSFF
jgi:hypothetical protein